MPARLSLKIVCVLAAVAFVAAFRLHAGGDEASGATAAATTLSPARAVALQSDSVRPVSKPVHARLAGAPGLPQLHRAPARPHHAAPHHSAPRVAVATPAPTAVATPAPTTVAPVVAAPPQQAAPAHSSPNYVGKSFDSKG